MNLVVDPVCGMKVDEKTTSYKTEWKGSAFFFCSPGCLASFKSDPNKYVR